MNDVILEERSNNVSSGLRTTYRSGPYTPVLHLDWIGWDSGFRGTGLAVGDDIVAVDGKSISPNTIDMDRRRCVGQPLESAEWAALGVQDGTRLRLTVRRRRIPGEGWETLEIEGTLRAERFYKNANGQQTMGIGGPARLLRDEFADAWAGWYEKRIFDWERQLDGGVWHGHGSSREELARHLESEPRVQYLLDHFPGSFATAVSEDWNALRVRLAGRQYQIEPEEYAYREAETKLVADVTTVANAAWEAFIATHAAEIMSAPGALDHVAGDEARYAGKLLKLPPTRADSWVTDVGRVFVSWRENGGWIFTPLESAAANRMWLAQERYRRHVSPTIADEFALIGRILPESRLIAPKGRVAVSGLEVIPLAALVGRGPEYMFVDMTEERDGMSVFAGEAAVQVISFGMPADEASPREVIEALIAALYARDERTWFALFADWHYSTSDGRVFYYPFYPYPDINRGPDWTRSRRVVLQQTLALRIVWIDEPRVVARSGERPGVPMIERVAAEIEHIGSFADEHRAFASIDVHRHWMLERRDGGPWRITTHQSI